MEMPSDFRELLALFSAHPVESLIVGGYALAFHGAPRFTGDLDILVRPDAANAHRILTALEAFGFASVGLTVSDFECPDQVVPLGVPPVRIDLITSITGVSWDEAWAGRTKDLAALEVLGTRKAKRTSCAEHIRRPCGATPPHKAGLNKPVGRVLR